MWLKGLVAVWGLSITAVLANMHSWHSFLFPAPEVAEVADFLEAKRPINLLHVMAQGCSCSGHLADYLATRGADPDAGEKVLVLGDMPEQVAELREAGFEVDNLSFAMARDRGFLSGVPLLVIFNQQREVAYIGGYTNTPITPMATFYDLRIAKSYERGETLEQYPVRGCAVSQEIQEMLDPFGLKYRSSNT